MVGVDFWNVGSKAKNVVQRVLEGRLRLLVDDLRLPYDVLVGEVGEAADLSIKSLRRIWTSGLETPWNYNPRVTVGPRQGKAGLWIHYRLPNKKRRYVRAANNRQVAERQARQKQRELEDGLFEQADLDRMPEVGAQRLRLSAAVDRYYELPPARSRKGKRRKASSNTRSGEEPSQRLLFDAFASGLGRRELTHVDEVDGDLLYDTIDALMRERGFGDTTANSYVKNARKMFNRFMAAGYHPGPNPADEIVCDWEDSERGVFVPPEHLREILKASVNPRCTVPLRELITVIAGTGLRVGEALHLEWFDIDFERHLIQIRAKPNTPTSSGQGWKPKWDKARTIVMPQLVAEVLKRLPRRVTSGRLPDGSYATASFVFPRKARTAERRVGATEYVRCGNVNKMWRTLLKEANLGEDGVLMGRFGIPKGSYRIHDLRRTYNTFGKEVAEFTDHEATHLLGNTREVNQKHYTVFLGTGTPEKVNRLAEYLLVGEG